MDTLRVSGTTDVKKLANAIMISLQETNQCELTCIGASSVNQCVKAIASANGLASTSGHTLVTTPYFRILSLENGEQKTAIVFLVTKVRIAMLGDVSSQV